MKFDVIVFDGKQFTYRELDKTLVSKVSELDHRHLQPINDTTYDRGFSVKNETTGHIITFILDDTKLFPDDDGICYWIYKPSLESITQYPYSAVLKAVVYNH